MEHWAADAWHLVRRFFGAVRPGSPRAEDLRWATGHLGEGEKGLWLRMNNSDQRHAIEVARSVVAELGAAATTPVVAAALLHDVGKVECGYRTPARVAATLVWSMTPAERATDWLDRGRPFRKLAQYRLHPEIGEELLVAAGADWVTSSWAADHHKLTEKWRLPVDIARVLKSCDDD